MASCNICADKYTKVMRMPIICENCNFECCLKCFKTYISKKETALKCMKCKNIFEHEFLEKYLAKTYMSKTIRSLEEELIFDKESEYLIGTQRELDLKKKNKEILATISTQRKLLKDIKDDLEYAIQESLIFELEKKMKDLTFNYIKKCSKTDCKGMLSEENMKNDNYLCSLCNSINCKDCEVILIEGDKHECDKNVLENLETLKKETKPCPTCLSRIYKSEGCDQMYCVKCFTTFDWVTGKIDTGRNHNPHYVNSFKHYNRDPLDIQCGRDLSIDVWNKEDNQYYKLVHDDNIKGYFCAIFNSRAYINLKVKETTNEAALNRNLRIDYLNKILDEKRYKKLCLDNVNKSKIQKELLNIVVTYMNCGVEIFYRLFEIWDYTNNKTTKKNVNIQLKNHIKRFEAEFKSLTDLCNEEFNKINNKKTKSDLYKLRQGVEHFK